MRIQTIDGDVEPREAGTTLAHEHLWAAFGGPSGDPDVELTCDQEILEDALEARAAGIRTLVEVTTVDMGADILRIAEIARWTGLQVVKSAGWFRSPTADRHVAGRTTRQLSDELVRELTSGFAGSDRRAGCLGEVGLAGTHPTAAETRVLDATASAARETGAGVVLHTDDAANGRALVAALLARRVEPRRLLVGHARPADPVGWHVEIAEQGSTLGFDQLGHPLRDPIEQVATRIFELLERVPGARIALSSDVGRRSRLRAFGGGGYAAAPFALIAELRRRGLTEPVLERFAGRDAAAFLALPEST